MKGGRLVGSQCVDSAREAKRERYGDERKREPEEDAW